MSPMLRLGVWPAPVENLGRFQLGQNCHSRENGGVVVGTLQTSVPQEGEFQFALRVASLCYVDG